MAKSLHVATVGPLPRICCGYINKAGDAFLSGKTDVTSDVLKAVVEYIGVGQEAQVKANGAVRYVIRVVEVEPRFDGGYAEWK
jgi:hypothetical protein